MIGEVLSTEMVFEWRPKRNRELVWGIPRVGASRGRAVKAEPLVPRMFREEPELQVWCEREETQERGAERDRGDRTAPCPTVTARTLAFSLNETGRSWRVSLNSGLIWPQP